MADSVRNYQQLAQDVIRLVGGKENIVSAERCATRLRLVLNEKPAGAEEEVKKLPGVITVVEKGGQFQIVIGPHVGDVFAVVSQQLNLDEIRKDFDTVTPLVVTNSDDFASVQPEMTSGSVEVGQLLLRLER